MTNFTNALFIELHVPNFDVAEKFYTMLGFEKVWKDEHSEFGGYLVMKLEDSALCFWPGNERIEEHSYFGRFDADTKRGYGVEIVVPTADIDGLYKKATELNVVVTDLVLRPWGKRDFRIEDPFGYYIRFTEPYNVLLRPKLV